MINPTNVIKLGANHIGVFDTSQHHHGFNMGSNRLQLVIEYLCSVSRFSWAGTNSLFLYENILFNFTIITYFTRFLGVLQFFIDFIICFIFILVYVQRMKERILRKKQMYRSINTHKHTHACALIDTSNERFLLFFFFSSIICSQFSFKTCYYHLHNISSEKMKRNGQRDR